MKRLMLMALISSAVLTGADTVPQPGQIAPDFSLPSQDGTRIGLKDLKGKWVVLYFYPKDGTMGCTIEARNFQRDIAMYEQNRAVIVGVSVDSSNSHQEFCAKQGLTFKLLADTEKAVSRQYGSLTNLLGYKIASRNTFLIHPNGRIAKVWTSVSPGKHSSEVLEAIRQLAH
ncbi:MAG: peroxiredoxin [Bryobacteraceae bacterium]